MLRSLSKISKARIPMGSAAHTRMAPGFGSKHVFGTGKGAAAVAGSESFRSLHGGRGVGFLRSTAMFATPKFHQPTHLSRHHHPTAFMSSTSAVPPLEFRKPQLSDVPSIYDIVLNTGLDVNSPYAYMVFCTHFADEGAVATQDGQVVGFIKGYRPPTHPDTIFVWQVGVHPDKGGMGIGGKLLSYLADRLAPEGVKFVEATVTPDNAASRALFSGFARKRACECRITDAHFKASDFPTLETPHLAEDLFRVGPYA